MSVAVLWHLHQPEYRDPRTGRPVMPWTRLHALRGYRDLLVESIEHGVPWTLNVVPGLVEQWRYYAEGGTDDHLDLTVRPADALDDDAVARVCRTFPCGNPVMRQATRYRELEAVLAERTPTTAELRDLQVWSTLAWVGATARRDHPVFDALVAKGRGFTEADKEALVAAQAAILAELPELLRRVAETDGPSISTTPLHHPILPLLVDLGHAARSVARPPTTSFQRPDHALEQLRRGRRVIEQAIGASVMGCWPSEGAVSPELVPLLVEAGFGWVATDEGILARSEREGQGEGPWRLTEGLVAFFRDRGLSDRVGFDYARWTTTAAVDDFVARAESPGVKLVALDGENPWEAFPDAGAAFREGMIAHLLADGLTLDTAATRAPVGTIARLHTGSWIDANLEIWAGSPADHRAWALLAETVEATADHPDALEPLLAAEGSDWFWWYGPEFATPFAETFDAAFRSHLRAAWVAAGRPPPAILDEPITTGPSVEPARPLDPSLGEPGWFGAARFVPPQGAMARGDRTVVEFGWDRDGVLWIRGTPGRSFVLDGVSGVLTEEGASFGARQTATLGIDGAWAELVARDWVV
jgi:alpha-amylase/alpha-mannosidase (GH57 family)